LTVATPSAAVPPPPHRRRTALVTGSTEGIGRAIAMRLARQGHEVVLHGVADDAHAREAFATLGAGAGDVRVIAADLADPAAVERLIAEAGAVDVLVLNAAVQVRQPLAEVDHAAIDLQVAVNLTASVRMLQAVLPRMRGQRWGRIVAIGSVQQRHPNPEMAIYAALKCAQSNLMRNVARQVAADGVTVNLVSPGVIRTRRNEAALADEAYARRVMARVPAGAFGAPDDVAGIVAFLCSDDARYITGADMPVDGGMHL
jgi:NAD(P)-dependent dehydrogenase (short-subunit alcohol dehydrogenase family)